MGDNEEGSEEQGPVKWPDKDDGWPLELVGATPLDIAVLSTEDLGDVAHFFTQLLSPNISSDLASISLITIGMSELDITELRGMLPKSSTFSILGIDDGWPTIIKSMMITFNSAEILAQYSMKDYGFLFACLKKEENTHLRDALHEKLQMLWAMGLTGQTSSEIIAQTAKLIMKAKTFYIDKLNAFLYIRQVFKEIKILLQGFAAATSRSDGVPREVWNHAAKTKALFAGAVESFGLLRPPTRGTSPALILFGIKHEQKRLETIYELVDSEVFNPAIFNVYGTSAQASAVAGELLSGLKEVMGACPKVHQDVLSADTPIEMMPTIKEVDLAFKALIAQEQLVDDVIDTRQNSQEMDNSGRMLRKQLAASTTSSPRTRLHRNQFRGFRPGANSTGFSNRPFRSRKGYTYPPIQEDEPNEDMTTYNVQSTVMERDSSIPKPRPDSLDTGHEEVNDDMPGIMRDDANSDFDGGSIDTTKSQLKLEHKMCDLMISIQDF